MLESSMESIVKNDDFSIGKGAFYREGTILNLGIFVEVSWVIRLEDFPGQRKFLLSKKSSPEGF